MATVTFCNQCGGGLELEDIARNRCPSCGAATTIKTGASEDAGATVSGTSSGVGPQVKKVCCVCGESVNGKPRMKDKQGLYYCLPCGKADATKKHTSGRTCPDCSDKFPLDDLHPHNGELVCEACYAKRRSRGDKDKRVFRNVGSEEKRAAAKKMQIIGFAGVFVLLVALYFLFTATF